MILNTLIFDTDKVDEQGTIPVTLKIDEFVHGSPQFTHIDFAKYPAQLYIVQLFPLQLRSKYILVDKIASSTRFDVIASTMEAEVHDTDLGFKSPIFSGINAILTGL
jgi:hypothetical protein